MKPTTAGNAAQRKTVGTKLEPDLIDLLDAIVKRRGDTDRASTIRRLILSEIESHFPGATGEAA
jgi:metal-responsive CopG/Arc/MetJ family transcriptional regulator